MFSNIRWKLLLGFLTILFCLFIAGYLSFHSLSSLVKTSNEAFYQDKTLTEIKDIISDINSAESGVIAYTITNDDYYLTPYYKLAGTINATMDSLNRSVTFDLVQQIKIWQLSALIKQKLSVYQDLLSIHYKDVIKQMLEDLSRQVSDQNGSDANGKKQTKTVIIDLDKTIQSIQSKSLIKYDVQAQQEITFLKKDKEVMTGIERVVNEMEAVQQGRIAEHAAYASSLANRNRVIVSLLIVLTLFIIALLAWLIFNDITKSNLYRNELIEAKRQAEKMAKVKEEFLANMSHEIRTPLTAIVGFSEQLSKTKIDPKQKQFLEAVHKSSLHLMKLVNSVLDFSKIESGIMYLEEAEFLLPDVVESVYMDLKPRALEKKIEFNYSTGDLEHVKLMGDNFKLKQILYNLAGNAIKFTDKGRVEMNFFIQNHGEDELLLKAVVSDTGIGITANDQDNIFAEFVQADSTTTRKYGGTGLGLAITKKLIEFQSGRIELQSERGKGSVFTFYLPYKKADGTTTTSKKDLKLSKNFRLDGKRILFADDDEMNRLLGETILINVGASVDFAVNGREALDKLNAISYDLVLMDIHMPEVSGVDVIREIRGTSGHINSEVRIIAITADVFKDELTKLEESGVNDLLLKPFSEEELLTKIFNQIGEPGGDSLVSNHRASTSTNGHKHFYDLGILEQVGKNDQAFVVHMVQVFLKNAKETLQKIKTALGEKDWETAGLMAHKLIPSYEQLGIEVAAEIRELQRSALNRTNLDGLSDLFSDIQARSEKVFLLLEDELSKRQESSEAIK